MGHWDELEHLVESAYSEFGRIDVLVNNAGISGAYERLSSVSEEQWDKVLGVNLKGPFARCALVGERMAADDGGSIINVSSTGAVRPTADIVPYAAAKAGVNAMTVGLADALGPKVRVNAIMPGPFLTSIAKNWDMDVLAARAETFPLRRAGEAREIVGAALYFATDASSFTTGTILTGRRRRAVEHARWGRSKGMSDPPTRSRAPLWLRAVHRLQRTIGEPIESVLRRTSISLPRCCVFVRAPSARWRVPHDGCCNCSICRPAATSAGCGAARASRSPPNWPSLQQGARRADEEPAAGMRAGYGRWRRASCLPSLVARVNRDLERSLLRARNGVRYVRRSTKPKVGATPKETVWAAQTRPSSGATRAARFATGRRS